MPPVLSRGPTQGERLRPEVGQESRTEQKRRRQPVPRVGRTDGRTSDHIDDTSRENCQGRPLEPGHRDEPPVQDGHDKRKSTQPRQRVPHIEIHRPGVSTEALPEDVHVCVGAAPGLGKRGEAVDVRLLPQVPVRPPHLHLERGQVDDMDRRDLLVPDVVQEFRRIGILGKDIGRPTQHPRQHEQQRGQAQDAAPHRARYEHTGSPWAAGPLLHALRHGPTVTVH